MSNSRGFFPRLRLISSSTVNPTKDDLLYFKKLPSPSHLKYPDNSFKTRYEERQKSLESLDENDEEHRYVCTTCLSDLGPLLTLFSM